MTENSATPIVPTCVETTRHLLQSKTFWFNVGTIAITAGGILPAKYAPQVIAIGNVILRLVSNGTVTLFPSSTDSTQIRTEKPK